jgi:hypothetical protein
MIMTHVDLIEKLLRYAGPITNSLLPAVIMQIASLGKLTSYVLDRYNPAERDRAKASMT